MPLQKRKKSRFWIFKKTVKHCLRIFELWRRRRRKTWSYELTPLAYRRLWEDAIEVYEYMTGIYKVDSSSMLPLAGLKTFKTRGHCLNTQKRHCRTKLRANFFSFRIVNMWNSLPDDVVLSPTLNRFRGRIDHHWRSLQYSLFYATAFR